MTALLRLKLERTIFARFAEKNGLDIQIVNATLEMYDTAIANADTKEKEGFLREWLDQQGLDAKSIDQVVSEFYERKKLLKIESK